VSWEGWTVFAIFWAVFVTTPGPNAVNCISNGVTLGFRRAVPGVLGILTQAALFLALSALGVSALLLASPVAFQVAKLIGAAFLIYLGLRTWRQAGRALSAADARGGSIYGRAFLIATINPKSVAGYLAAFTQFVQPDVPITQQMWVIVPTALSLTALSYSGYTALGAMLGRSALGAVASRPLRRGLALCFVVYGALLGATALPWRA